MRLKVIPALSLFLKNIAHSPDRVDHFVGEVFIDLVSQTADQDIHHIGLGIETVVVHMLQDGCLGYDAPFIPDKIFEQRKFSCGKADLTVSPLDLPGQQINGKIARAELGGLGNPG